MHDYDAMTEPELKAHFGAIMSHGALMFKDALLSDSRR